MTNLWLFQQVENHLLQSLALSINLKCYNPESARLVDKSWMEKTQIYLAQIGIIATIWKVHLKQLFYKLFNENDWPWFQRYVGAQGLSVVDYGANDVICPN